MCTLVYLPLILFKSMAICYVSSRKEVLFNAYVSTTAVARGLMFTGCSPMHPFHSHEQDISGMPRGNSFRFGASV